MTKNTEEMDKQGGKGVNHFQRRVEIAQGSRDLDIFSI